MTGPVNDDMRWIVPDWPAPAGVNAVTTTRRGGCSVPPFDSLNLATHVGDDPAAVDANRRTLVEALVLPSEPAWLEQVHGVEVVDAGGVTTPVPADASVAFGAGTVCAVQTADCMPVAFCHRSGGRVGVAHAGWRGLADGVLEATIAALDCPAADLMAWLGPAIGPRAFEVGEEVRAAFLDRDAGAGTCFVRNERGRWMADLYALARRRLARAGVEAVYGGGWCTFGESDRFFSYRRDGRTGRMATLIWISEPG